MERAALVAQAFARAALAARAEGLRPHVVVGHSGWGPGLCARDVFPEAAYVAYCEWWYRHPGPDVAYLTEAGLHPPDRSPEAPMFERMRNAPIALDVASADAVICPTRFQAAQFPEALRASMTVAHDGVDAGFFHPDPTARRATLGGLVAPDARVVTYATRGMEPHRGFPQFMAALPRILAADPRAMAVIAGENRVAYGGDALRRTDWRAEALRTPGLDSARVRFVGRLARDDYLALLQRSDAHVYLTVPFVLSWSMLEAMSAGCALVLSDTEPIREFADQAAARLVDHRRPEAIAEAVLATLADPGDNAARRERARAAILATVPLEACHARRERLFRDLAGQSAGPRSRSTCA
jgi:glycosyltransferase involved in cell wall biosynthesis